MSYQSKGSEGSKKKIRLKGKGVYSVFVWIYSWTADMFCMNCEKCECLKRPRNSKEQSAKWQNLLDQVFTTGTEGESQTCKPIYLKALFGGLVVFFLLNLTAFKRSVLLSFLKSCFCLPYINIHVLFLCDTLPLKCLSVCASRRKT